MTTYSNPRMEAVITNWPHGRDYYPQGDGAIGEAMAQHRRWCTMLQQIDADLAAIQEHIEADPRLI